MVLDRKYPRQAVHNFWKQTEHQSQKCVGCFSELKLYCTKHLTERFKVSLIQYIACYISYNWRPWWFWSNWFCGNSALIFITTGCCAATAMATVQFPKLSRPAPGHVTSTGTSDTSTGWILANLRPKLPSWARLSNICVFRIKCHPHPFVLFIVWLQLWWILLKHFTGGVSRCGWKFVAEFWLQKFRHWHWGQTISHFWTGFPEQPLNELCDSIEVDTFVCETSLLKRMWGFSAPEIQSGYIVYSWFNWSFRDTWTGALKYEIHWWFDAPNCCPHTHKCHLV